MTLGEILVSLAIVVIMASLSVSAFSNLRSSSLVQSASQEILSQMRFARSQSVESLGNSLYGVHIDATSTALFTGPLYQSGASSNVLLILPIGITASATPPDFVFQKISGNTTSGTIEVYVSSNPSFSKTISVGSTGLAEIN